MEQFRSCGRERRHQRLDQGAVYHRNFFSYDHGHKHQFQWRGQWYRERLRGKLLHNHADGHNLAVDHLLQLEYESRRNRHRLHGHS